MVLLLPRIVRRFCAVVSTIPINAPLCAFEAKYFNLRSAKIHLSFIDMHFMSYLRGAFSNKYIFCLFAIWL